mgnify:CR=1 FL=1
MGKRICRHRPWSLFVFLVLLFFIAPILALWSAHVLGKITEHSEGAVSLLWQLPRCPDAEDKESASYRKQEVGSKQVEVFMCTSSGRTLEVTACGVDSISAGRGQWACPGGFEGLRLCSKVGGRNIGRVLLMAQL